MDTFGSHRSALLVHSKSQTGNESSIIPGATTHSAIYAISTTTLQNTFISFLSYIKTREIPILPITLPDVRSVHGRGASFLVNGAEIPETYVDPISGVLFPQGMIVAFKRAIINGDMEDPVADRIRVIYNELLTMQHPPLSAHPNIVNLLGIGFENEGLDGSQIAMPVLIPECAELGNLAEVLRTARREDRLLKYEEKLSLCLDVAHGLEVLHACDIVHGDVKFENVLVFERATNDEVNDGRGSVFELYCKMIDFGISRFPSGKTTLGGSRPWQAPECLKGAWFGLEEAKRTDVYSFGMLIWGVFLDGDPFQSVTPIDAKSQKEKIQRRNNAITKIKDDDELVHHVCNTLALSGSFSRLQLGVLYEVIGVTLIKDASRRELDMGQLIRLLMSDSRYESRFAVPPIPIPTDIKANLLDIERSYSDFESTSPVVQSQVVSGFREHAERLSEMRRTKYTEDRTAAAYQLAICYADGFGVPFQPLECVKWLKFAMEGGSQKAEEALPNVTGALKVTCSVSGIDVLDGEIGSSTLACPQPLKDLTKSTTLTHAMGGHGLATETPDIDMTSAGSEWTILSASQCCRYDVLNDLLATSAQLNVSQDGVSSLHFLSCWNVEQAGYLACRLIHAGADINAQAIRGATIGGTPLMWSVYGGHLEHSSILIGFGADPLASTHDGDDALSTAARSHQASHLRLLLRSIRPAQVCGHVSRLIEAAAGGESRFSRMNRHKEKWMSTAEETLQLLQDWYSLFADFNDFTALLLQGLRSSLKSAYGRMNTDVQMCFIKKLAIQPSDLCELLSKSVLTFNVDLFSSLLDYGVPVTSMYGCRKTIVHLCAKIPDHSLAATTFAPRLLDLGAILDTQDEDGLTPWMEAVLERKWDLADLLMKKGASPFMSSKDGFNILGLCINALNLGSIKYLLKYSAEANKLYQESFLVNSNQQISALQLATTLLLPRSQGMKLEVTGIFMSVLDKLGSQSWQLDFRSSGILPEANALDIAASLGNTHAVKNLVMRGAHSVAENRISALAWINAKRAGATVDRQRTDLERCAFIIENWDAGGAVRTLADDWTKTQRDEDSHIASSWEVAPLNYKMRKGL